MTAAVTVSYTHLDVYKRQLPYSVTRRHGLLADGEVVEEIGQRETAVTEQSRRRQLDVRPSPQIHLTLSQREHLRVTRKAIELDQSGLDLWVTAHPDQAAVAVLQGERLEQVSYRCV